MVEKKPPILNEEDHHVWAEYTRCVKPLKKIQWEKLHHPTFEMPVDTPASSTHKIITKNNIVKPPSARDLKNVQIHARLDLHGLTLEKAHDRMIRFITNSYHLGHRCVLIITGKGLSRSLEWWQEQNLLRHQVPRWLNEEPMHSKIANHSLARPEHGGTGALYVFIKKKKVL